ncbi:MAG: DUF4405 domain-containing protein [Planctomycetota bacterium]|jgi:hypothetical protein
MMKRTTLNFVIDLISFIDLLGMVTTGMIMMYVLPPGTGGGGYRGGRGPETAKLLWSLSRHQWGKIHYCLALLFIVLMTAHILLHWTWIKTCFKSLLGICGKADAPES